MKVRDIVFSVIITALLLLLARQCEKTERVVSAYETSQETAKIWRDKEGHSNAEITVLKQDLQLFKRTQRAVIDSLESELRIKPRQVRTIQTITTETRDTIRYVVGRPYTSKWMSYNFIDSSRLVFSTRDSLALITHRKPYGFLHLKNKYVTRAVSYNPHTTITGMTSTEIVPAERRLSLGLYAGYGATLNNGTVRVGPQLGFGINFRLF